MPMPVSGELPPAPHEACADSRERYDRCVRDAIRATLRGYLFSNDSRESDSNSSSIMTKDAHQTDPCNHLADELRVCIADAQRALAVAKREAEALERGIPKPA